MAFLSSVRPLWLLPRSLVDLEDGHHGCFLFRLFGHCGKMMGFGPWRGGVQRWLLCVVNARLLSWGSWLQSWNFALKYGLLSEEKGQATRVRSLNVKFSYCPGCYLHKFLGERVLRCYHSFFPSVCLFFAFMSAPLVILLACHWTLITECGADVPDGSQRELWHITVEGKDEPSGRAWLGEKWERLISWASTVFCPQCWA